MQRAMQAFVMPAQLPLKFRYSNAFVFLQKERQILALPELWSNVISLEFIC